VVVNTEDSNALFIKFDLPIEIGSLPAIARVVRAVQLNGKFGFAAEEVHDPVPERMLPAKLQIRHLAVAQA
jgi:hypothetical protein